MANFRHQHYKTLPSESLIHRVWNGRLVPLVLAYNGAVPSGTLDPHVFDGVKDHRLDFGTLNYWILREWASYCLGSEAEEVGEVPLGEKGYVLALEPEMDHSSPPVTIEFGRRAQTERVTLGGRDMSWTAFLEHISAPQPVAWNGFSFMKDWVSGIPLPTQTLPSGVTPKPVYVPSAYRFFASRAVYSGPGRSIPVGAFPRVRIPYSPLCLDRTVEAVYKRAAFSGDKVIMSELRENGYVYSYDEAAQEIYYSNLVSVGGGYPPVASAMGWHKMPLQALPDDWVNKLDRGYLAVGLPG